MTGDLPLQRVNWLSLLCIVVSAVAFILCAVRGEWQASLVAVGALILGFIGWAVAATARGVTGQGTWDTRPRSLRAWVTYRVAVSSVLSLAGSVLALLMAFKGGRDA